MLKKNEEKLKNPFVRRVMQGVVFVNCLVFLFFYTEEKNEVSDAQTTWYIHWKLKMLMTH